MKKLHIILLVALVSPILCLAQAGVPFTNEILKYVVQYKWGMVQKNAATATITLRNNPQNYPIRLTAATLPWADKLFPLRDTLSTTISKATFRPVNYTKVTHENGKYRKDIINYTYVGNHVYGQCTRAKAAEGGRPTVSKKSFSSTGPTYDMVSIFYFVRALNFDKLNGGKIVKASLFSGSGVESIKIKNVGIQNTKLPNGKSYRCYHLQLTFTSQSGKTASAPLDVWVTTDKAHTPVKMVGKLPIGQVRCFLTSGL